ncbi:histidine phosphatase family protein [Butyrivibrio sp. MC2013]|uniref:histidine phosphatase family protein n=1 Tax=Butyrivibrio sp. MC2013 TaxID=1280686 RepID=UPI0003FCF12B|nr:histidine phosphatase family protein [Butyrivibrio sp. MC2013]
MKLILIRHGMTTAGRGRYIGRTDVSLSIEGRRDIIGRKAAGQYPECSLLISSPMKRCIETSRIIYPDMEPLIIDEFKECDFGLWEGRSYREIIEDPSLSDDYQKWIDSGATAPIPMGEDREVFTKRVIAGYEKLLDIIKMSGDCSAASLVVHGGTIMAIMSHISGEEKNFYDYMTDHGEMRSVEIGI